MGRFGNLPDGERCTAHTSASSYTDRCAKPRAHGTTVCTTHGAANGQSRTAGQRRRQQAKAEAAVVTYGLPVEVDPHDALIAEVHRSAGHVAWLAGQVENLDKPTQVNEGPGGAQRVDPHVLVELYQRERAHLVAVCKTAIAAGIDERRVQLAEAQGQAIVAVLRATLEDLGVEVTPEVAATVGRHLRAVS